MGDSNGEVLRNPVVSFIIVNYNGEEFLERCLSSIESQDIKSECIVIDNASSDNSRKIIKKHNVNTIFNDRNLGYPGALNQGINIAKGNYIFLMTPTTFLRKNSIILLLEKFKKKRIGAIAPKLIDEDGNLVKSISAIPEALSFIWELLGGSRLLPSFQFFKPWKLPHFNYNEDSEVEQPMSCALLIKKKIVEDIGFFDERFFLYFSDVDFSKRILKKYKILYISGVEVFHIRGGISYKMGPERILVYHKDMISYLKKYHPFLLFIIGVPLIVIGEIRFLCAKFIQTFSMSKKNRG